MGNGKWEMHEECSGLASCLRPRSKERIISEAFASKTDVFIAVLMLFDTPFFHFHFSFFILHFKRPRLSHPRRRRRRYLLRPPASQPPIRSRELDAVQQDHRRDVDPEHERDHGPNGSVNAET